MQLQRLSTTLLPTLLLPLTTVRSTPACNSTHAPYILTDDLSYHNFFPSFTFFSDPDPTQGFVQYQNLSSAISLGLVAYLNTTNTIYIGADFSTSDSLGRASVRLESKKSWNQGLLIADIKHMPASECGVWPAFWLLSASADWPEGGEVDIIEGVNDYMKNAITLHTGNGCMVDNGSVVPVSDTGGGAYMRDSDTAVPLSSSGAFTGTMATSDCDVAAVGQPENAGCNIRAPEVASRLQLPVNDNHSSGGGCSGTTRNSTKSTPLLSSYGTPFNNVGGGIYATEWTSSSISVWFFPRSSIGYSLYFSSSSSPNNTSILDPTAWGPPMAHFSGPGCDFSRSFRDLKIVINTAFCGAWAGAEWDEGGCREKTGVETCEEYVLGNAGVYREAYWEIGRLQWFQRV